MKCDEIHWWQFPLADFSIQLRENFKKKFFDKAYKQRSISKKFASYINEKSKKYRKPLNFRKQRALLWAHKTTSKFVPAWLVYEMAKFLKMDLTEIEKNIESYISFRGRVVVSKPKLPIQVTPEFTSIAIHIMCDGFAFPNGKFSYCQKSEKSMKRFIRLVKNIFGDYDARYNRAESHTPQHYTPNIFGNIISDYYNIKTYLSSKCRIPIKLKYQNRLHRIAALAAFLLDDGNTTSAVRFYSPSKEFLIDTKEIAESLGYRCGSIIVREPKKKMKQRVYSINISTLSISNFFNDLNELFNLFSDSHIGKKFQDIKKFVQIKNRGWKQRGKGETKLIILNSLKEGAKTAYELRDAVNVSLWTVYHHLQQLMKLNKVQKYKVDKKVIKYKLNN